MLRLLIIGLCLVTLAAVPVYAGEVVEPAPEEMDSAAEQSAQAIWQAKELQNDPTFNRQLRKQTRESLDAAQETTLTARKPLSLLTIGLRTLI